MPRGGKRQGKPGQAYGNRQDLTQAPSAAPGQTYGVQAQQLRAQQTAPLPKQAPPSLAPAAGPPGGPTPPGAQPTMQPGGLGPLHAPTDNPNQPLTAGLPSGPGPGPEAFKTPDPLVNAAAVLNQMGDTNDPVARALRARVNAALGNQGAA